MLGMVLAQLAVSIAQSVLVLVASIVVPQLELEPNQILLMFFVIVVGSLCFIGFGALLATFATKPDMVKLALRLYPAADGFPRRKCDPCACAGRIGEFFPTTLLTELLHYDGRVSARCRSLTNVRTGDLYAGVRENCDAAISLGLEGCRVEELQSLCRLNLTQ